MTRLRDIRIVDPLDKFGNMRVENATPQINLKSIYGVSAIRDIVTTAGAGAIATVQGEYELSTGAASGGIAKLDSVERGRYQAGFSAESGIGVRLSTDTFVGDQYAQWGYYDDDNGLGYGVDANGVYVFVRRGGSDTKVYQQNWNVDKFDGTSEYTALSLTGGTIFQVSFSWYGYGQLSWQIVETNTTDLQFPGTAHYVVPDGNNSIESPNLPVRAEISNGTTNADLKLYVGGRQFKIQGNYAPDVRVTGQERVNQTIPGTTFVPLVTFRHKASFVDGSVRAAGFDIITDAPLIYAVFIGGTLTGASFNGVTDVPDNETAVEVDISATAITSPVTSQAKGLVPTSGGGNQRVGDRSNSGLGFNVPENSTVTLAARLISGTNATVTSVFRVTEEW